MKKHLLFLIAILPLLSHAQGEWLWAKSYTGQDAYGGYPNNEIICADFDQDGNIYIFGKFGKGAVINDIQLFPDSLMEIMRNFLQDPYYSIDPSGTILAKLSPQGELLWKKVIKMEDTGAEPGWMEIKDDKIYFLANTLFSNMLFYLDTLVLEANYVHIEEHELPFTHNYLNCFVTLDLDGNVLEQHFFRLEDTFYDNPIVPYPLTFELSWTKNPFHVDRSGNIFLLANVSCFGGNIDEPLIIFIDEEKSFDIYPHRKAGRNEADLPDWFLFKFSPEWDMLWYKQLVHHTTGINHELMPVDPNGYLITVNNMSFDEEDNLYICGSIDMSTNGIPDGYHSYPLKVYWDSIHHTIIKGKYSATEQSFLCKYDTSGNVQWTKQLYPSYSGEVPNFIASNFRDVVVKGNDVYLFGNASDVIKENSIPDNFIDEALTIPIGRLNNQQARTYYIKYNRQNGEYINHSFVPHANKVGMSGKADIINNHIVFSNTIGLRRDSLLITYFRDDGQLMRGDYSRGKSGNIHIHESGKLFFYTQTKSSLTIGDFYLPQTGNYSMAAFALQEDPSLLTPYEYGDIGITSYEQNQKYQLYPNPTSGEVSLGNALVAHAYIHDYLKMELYDLSGRKLTETTAYSLNLAPYAPGMYIVKIQFINGQAVSRKVVRN